MRVLLVGVPGFHTQDEPLFPLGLGYLISALEESGHEAKGVYFIREEHMKKALPEFIQGFSPDMIGFSCNTFNRGVVKRAIQQVKSLNSKIKIVSGGPHPSYLDDQVLEYGADFIVRGEGEVTLAELCRAIETNYDLVLIEGISFINKEHQFYRNKDRVIIKDLDTIPIPNYSYVKDIIVDGNMGYLMTTRGCPSRCKYCSSGSYWGQNVRSHSPERVMKELEILVSKYGISRFRIHDNTFNYNVPRVMEFCKLIIQHGLKLSWGVCCRVYPVSPEMIEAMVEAGCIHIAWGVESGSKVILEAMGKNITQDQIRYAYSLCEPYSKKGLLSTRTYMMVGFPGETKETVQETINFLNTLSMTDRPDCMVVYVIPGTQLWEEQKVVDKNYWSKTDDILYIHEITGQNLGLLYEWAKAIEAAGRRIPFDDSKHFWNGITKGKIPEPQCPTFN